MTAATAPPTDTRGHSPSAFVTVIAWMFILHAVSWIVVSVFACIAAPFFVAKISVMARGGAPLLFWLDYAVPGAVVSLALAVATLVSAIGLLRRRPWSRQVFIAMLVIQGVGSVGITVLVLTQAVQPADVDVLPAFVRYVMGAAELLALLSVGGLLAMFAWVAVKLYRPPARDEFA